MLVQLGIPCSALFASQCPHRTLASLVHSHGSDNHLHRLPTVRSVSPVWPSLFCLRPVALTTHGTSVSWMPCRHLQFSTPQREFVTWQSPKTIRITLIRPSIGVGLSHGSLSSSTQLCQLWVVHTSPANLLHTSLCLRESVDLSSHRLILPLLLTVLTGSPPSIWLPQ